MKKLLLALLATTAISSPVLASDHNPKAGDWMIRGRVLGVVPQEDSKLSIGGEVKVDNSVVPEVDFTYFFTPNIAAELIAAVTPHDVKTDGGVDAGGAWLLPPTLTLQYHFTNFEGIKPYVGAGINYTHFFSEDAGVLNNVDYDDSFGFALQVGVDVPLKNNWYVNLDVKKVYIDTTAKFNPSGVRADVDIDPWLIGAGLAYKF